MTNIASFPQFTRLLKRYWGADLSEIDGENPDPKALYRAIAQQSALIQQLVEELASFMGKSESNTLYAPLNITVDGTQQGDTEDGVPSQNCGSGWGALVVRNYGSSYDTGTKIVSGGHAAIFDGVISADAICTRFISVTDENGTPVDEIGQASYITFQLNSGFANPASVLDYFNGTSPGSLVTVGDPHGLFPNYLANAKGRAFYYPAGDYYVAVECEESTTASTSSTLTAGCGIDITTGGEISVNAAQLAGSGLKAAATCSLELDLGSGVSTGASGLTVCLASGLDFDSSGCIHLQLSSGTQFTTNNKLSICLSSGLDFNASGCIKMKPGSGVSYDTGGGMTLNVSNNFKYVSNYLTINAGSGITYSTGSGSPGPLIVFIDNNTITYDSQGRLTVGAVPNSTTVTGVVVALRVNGTSFQKKTRSLKVLSAGAVSAWTDWAVGTNCAT